MNTSTMLVFGGLAIAGYFIFVKGGSIQVGSTKIESNPIGSTPTQAQEAAGIIRAIGEAAAGMGSAVKSIYEEYNKGKGSTPPTSGPTYGGQVSSFTVVDRAKPMNEVQA